MALSVMHSQGVIGFGVDTATGERGIVQKLVNGTGGATVKGTVVTVSTSADSKFILQATEYDSIGVVAEAGVANDSAAWVWINGSVCQVLFKDGESATRGYVAIAADTDGRGKNVSVPTGTPTQNDHWKEIGHVMQSVADGTDILVLCHLHFN
jgi:hypothetical protein